MNSIAISAKAPTARTADPAAAAFWTDGYRIADNLVTPQQCLMLRRGMDHARDAGLMRVANNRAYKGPHNQYAPVPAQMILGALLPRVSALVGRELLPSFAFWRIYRHGDQLNAHKDRIACEVAITIALVAEPAGHVWPINVRDFHGVQHSVALAPGAGLLYQGAEVEHWRAPMTGEAQYQMFLNYVLADGPNAGLAYDGGTAFIP